MDKDQELLFKDLGATAQQTVEQVRGLEENYFSVLQKTMSGIPWIVDLNRKVQDVAEEQLATGLKFAHSLSDARNFEDLVQIQTEFWQAELIAFSEQTKTLGKAYTKAVADAMNPPLNRAA
jgi:hypothetical protein